MPSIAPRLLAGLPLILTGSAIAAGLSTHFHAADLSRAQLDRDQYAELYRLLKKKHPQANRVGSIHPDWGYSSAEYEAAAETAHWEPFYTAALDHLLAHYPQPWDKAGERLFVYICGIGSHSIFDEVWHFGDTAFLTLAMAESNASDPEFEVELFTDIFVQVEQRGAYLENPFWWIPVDDLVQIYTDVGHPEVTVEALEAGTALQHLALMLEDTLGWSIYLPGLLRLPWTHANYMDWWDGGVRDGAAQTAALSEYFWDYTHGSEAASQPLFEPIDFEHEPQPLLALAARMVRTGVIEPRWHRVEGGVEFLPPRVHDWVRFDLLLADFAAQWSRTPTAP
jgi:hypothetical protein